MQINRDIKNRIHQVGIELEGAWVHPPKRLAIHRDGSLQFPEFQQQVVGPPLPTPRQDRPTEITVDGVTLYIGEVQSLPLLPASVEEFIRRAYPQHVNATCGLHVHLSFKNRFLYQRLMDSKFQDMMFRTITDWAEDEKFGPLHPIWHRLSGEHRQCKRWFAADRQIFVTRKIYDHDIPHSRYTGVNYAWRLHGTIECRILPMFETPDQAVRGVNVVMRTTNQFLARNREKEKRYICTLPPLHEHQEHRSLNFRDYLEDL